MAYLIRTPPYFFLPLKLTSSFHPSSFLALSRGLKPRRRPIRISFPATKQGRSSRGRDFWGCWCFEGPAGGGGGGGDVDAELEARILEFMRNSHKPEAFPTRKELEEAGRFDLVEEIRRKGGWFSLGWDCDEDVEEEEGDEGDDIDFDLEEFRRRVKSCGDSRAFEDSLGIGGSSESVSSSGRSLENGAEEDSGVEAILRRLEKHRKSSFDISSENSGNGKGALSRDDGNNMNIRTNAVDYPRYQMLKHKISSFVCCKKGRSNLGETSTNASDSWRTWSIRRAGFQDTDFEPAEISFRQSQEGERTYIDETVVVTENGTGYLHRQNGINPNDIRSRILHLEIELNSLLQLMRSKNEEYSSKEVIGSYPSDVQNLSDALEFQENEFMHAQERLRSMRAKITVLKGKMALATTVAQKMVKKKQNRSDAAYLRTQLLRTTHIVWPNSASEVLLAGSFDGWTSQRKMKKSSAGIFSVTLLLYPGKYEIKFIVDGKWRVDPLRPTINNHGNENNLLIIT